MWREEEGEGVWSDRRGGGIKRKRGEGRVGITLYSFNLFSSFFLPPPLPSHPHFLPPSPPTPTSSPPPPSHPHFLPPPQPDWQPLVLQLEALKINLKQHTLSCLGIVTNALMQVRREGEGGGEEGGEGEGGGGEERKEREGGREGGRERERERERDGELLLSHSP